MQYVARPAGCLHPLRIRLSLLSMLMIGWMSPALMHAQASFTGAQTTVGSGFGSPYGVAVDSKGNVYVSDFNSSVYEVEAVNGSIPASPTIRTLANFDFPLGVTVDVAGNVYVAEFWGGTVKEILAVDGVIPASPTVNTLATRSNGLSEPSSVAVDGNGNVFLSDYGNGNIYEMLAVGGSIPASPTIVTLDSGLQNPADVVLDSSGDVYVADQGDGLVLEILAVGGSFPVSPTIKTLSTAFPCPTGVAVDASGDVYVADNCNANVSEMLAVSGSLPASPTVLQLSNNVGNPWGVALDPDGNVDVADNNGNVWELFPRGSFGSVAVGSASSTIPMGFSIASGTTVGNVGILTTGIVGKDFADAGSSTCTAQTYSSATNCVVNVNFTPQVAGLRRGAVVLYDGSGNALATAPFYGIGTGPQVAFGPGLQSSVVTGLSNPIGVATDASGNLFVADQYNSAVKEILAAGGYSTVNILASAYTLSGGFQQPATVAVDGAGNVFVADTNNESVKEILAAGGYNTVNTLASGFTFLWGIAVDGAGNVFVSDVYAGVVDELPVASGYATVTPLSGYSGAPKGIAVDGSGNVFVADVNNNSIIEIPVAGGYATSNTLVGGFNNPTAVALDASGNLYVADTNNSLMKEVLAAGGYTTVVNLGSGFDHPQGVAVDGRGNVFLTDTGNGNIDEIDVADPPSMSFAGTQVNDTSTDSPHTVQVANIGNQTLAMTALSYPTDFPQATGDSSACTGSTSLNAGHQCDLPIDFTPQSATALSENVTLTDNALNVTGAIQSIGVSGTGQAQVATHFSVTGPSPVSAGAPFTVAVTALDASNHTVTGYAGTVHFISTDPAAGLPGDSTLSGGSGAFLVTLNTAGAQSITPRDSVNSSIIGAGNFMVNPGAATHLGITAPSSATGGHAISFTVTAYDADGNVATGYAGTIQFTSTDPGATLPAPATLTAGTGAFPATLVTAGLQTITGTDSVASTITGTSNSIAVTITGGGTGPLVSHTIQISNDADDGYFNEQDGSGWHSDPQYGGADLVGSWDGITTAFVTGYRFPSTGINSGDTIRSAYLQLVSSDYFGTSAACASEPCTSSNYTYRIYGVAQDDGASFSGAAGNTPVDVPYTTAYVDYTSTGPGDDHGGCQGNNNGQNTCTHFIDVSNIVKEITSRPGWTSASAMRFVLLSTDGTAPNVYAGYEDYSANPSRAATLVVNPPLPTIVSSGAWGTDSQTTYPTTYATGPFVYPGASTLLLFLGDYYNLFGSLNSQPAVSDSCGNSWNILAGPTNWAGIVYGMRSTVYYVQNPASCPAGDTITITVADTTDPIFVHFLAVAGSDTTQPPVVSAITSPSPGTYTTSATSNPITLPNAGLLVSWIFGDSDAPHTFTPQTGFTTDLNSTPNYLTAVFESESSPGSYQSQFSISPSDGWQVVMIGLPAPSAGPPAITSSDTANATVGAAFSFQIAATNTPTSFGASGLPTGLTVNTTSGLISGTPTAPGTFNVTVSATNSGGTVCATLTLTILGTQTITFTPPPTLLYGVASFDLSSYASASSGLPVTFQVISGPATLNGSVVTITGAGSVVIQANQAGNAVYAAANPVSNGFIVNPYLSPASGSTLLGATATFAWNAGAGPTGYELWLGTTGVGTSDLYNSGPLSSSITSVNVTGIPTNGVEIYATLWSKINGLWKSNSYTYTEAGSPVLASLTTPSPGGVLSGSSATFSWTAGGGPTQYELWLGTTGVGSANVYNSGSTTSTSENVTVLPTNGVKMYARLWSYVNGVWKSADYTFTEAGSPVLAALTFPTPGNQLAGSSATFTWTAGGGPTLYELWLGTTGVGSANVYNSGSTTSTSENVTVLPTNGVKMYARLWSYVNGVWQSIDYTYTEAGTPVLATLSLPTPGNQLAGSSATFTWTPGAGPTLYELWLGTTGVGTANLYNSGSTTATSENVTGLPTNGVKIYARLWSYVSGVWQSIDYTYTEAGTPVLATMTSPSPGTQLTSSSATFSWTAGAGPTLYELWLGTTGVGTANLYNSGSATSTSENVTGLPTNGVKIYARLWSYVSGVWQSIDYTYTEAGTPVLATLSLPTPGNQLAGSSATFTWTPGAGPTLYELWLGTTGVGTANLYNSGSTAATSENVTALPTNGVKIYARLWSYVSGVWQSIDYTYTEAGTPVLATLSLPTPGNQLTSSSATFSWTPGAGPTLYELWLGTTGVGTANLYNSGSTAATSENVTGLPTNGVNIYARLWSYVNGVWQSIDYTYTAQ